MRLHRRLRDDETFVELVGRHGGSCAEREMSAWSASSRHAQFTPGVRQASEHVEVGQALTGLILEIRLELAHQRGVGPEQ